jgi:hypothetical protein
MGNVITMALVVQKEIATAFFFVYPKVATLGFVVRVD